MFHIQFSFVMNFTSSLVIILLYYDKTEFYLLSTPLQKDPDRHISRSTCLYFSPCCLPTRISTNEEQCAWEILHERGKNRAQHRDERGLSSLELWKVLGKAGSSGLYFKTLCYSALVFCTPLSEKILQIPLAVSIHLAFTSMWSAAHYLALIFTSRSLSIGCPWGRRERAES